MEREGGVGQGGVGGGGGGGLGRGEERGANETEKKRKRGNDRERTEDKHQRVVCVGGGVVVTDEVGGGAGGDGCLRGGRDFCVSVKWWRWGGGVVVPGWGARWVVVRWSRNRREPGTVGLCVLIAKGEREIGGRT